MLYNAKLHYTVTNMYINYEIIAPDNYKKIE